MSGINCIDRLPDEVLEMIFDLVPRKETLSQVSRRWDAVVDGTFGLPVTVPRSDLRKLGEMGVSSCVVTDPFISVSWDEESQSQQEESFSGFLYPQLLRHLGIHSKIGQNTFGKLLARPVPRYLTSLTLTWNCLGGIDPAWLETRDLTLRSLKELTIHDDDSYLRKVQVLAVYHNILLFLASLKNLQTLHLSLPEPKCHFQLTQSIILLLDRSASSLREIDLTLDAEGGRMTLPIVPPTPEQVQTLETLALRIGGQLSLTRFRFCRLGRRLQFKPVWTNLWKGLRDLEEVELQIYKADHLPLSVTTGLIQNSRSTLKICVIEGGPRFGFPVEDYPIDMALFNGCLELKTLELNFYENVESSINVNFFPKTLNHVNLTNFALCFEEIFSIVCEMDHPHSTLNLADNWIEMEAFDGQDTTGGVLELFEEQVRAIVEKVIGKGKIACFALGKLRFFPSEGIVVGLPGDLMTLLPDSRGTVHLHDFRVSQPVVTREDIGSELDSQEEYVSERDSDSDQEYFGDLGNSQ